MTGRVTAADLRTVDLFDDTDDAALETWAQAATVREVEPGTVLADQGKEAEGVLLLLRGSALSTLVYPDREEPAGRQVAPTWMGAIAVLTGGPLGVRLETKA